MRDPDFVESMGLPLLAHRLRRVSDALVADVGELLDHRHVDIPPRAGSLVMLLRSCTELAVTAAAQRLGLSHTMIINLARALKEAGLVEDALDPQDSRRRLLRLTNAGHEQAQFLDALNRALAAAYGQMFEETGIDLFAALEAFERAAARESVLDRVAALLEPPDHPETSS